MLIPNPLTMFDVTNAMMSTIKIFWIKKHFYIPFALVVAACSWGFNSSYSSLPIVPFIGLFFPSLCVVLAAFLDQNRSIDVTTVVRSTLTISLYMIFFSIPSALLLYVLLFHPIEFFGFLNSFAPGFLKADFSSELLTTSKVISLAFTLTLAFTIFTVTGLTTSFQIAYLRARHGLSEDDAHEKTIQYLGSMNPAHAISQGVCMMFYMISLPLCPSLGLVFIAIAFTYEYFIYKAMYDGTSNTDAVEAKASKSATSTA